MEKKNKFMDFLFGNPGKKIKIIAIAVFLLVTIVSLFRFAKYCNEMGNIFKLMAQDSYYIEKVLKFFVFPAAQYIISLFLTGFGELIENSKKD